MTREARGGQLLEVAERVFAERGFGDTSLDDLCSAAGVTKPLIYDHFPGGKNELFLTCVRRVREKYHVGLAEAGSLRDPREQVRHAAHAYLSLLHHDRGRWELLFGPAQSGGDELGQRLLEERGVTIKLLADMVRRSAPHLDQRDAELHAHLLSGAGEQVGRWWVRYPDVSLEDVVDMFVGAVWHGLGPLFVPLGEPHGITT